MQLKSKQTMKTSFDKQFDNKCNFLPGNVK